MICFGERGRPLEYPVWRLPETGGGLLIAAIAVVHVFIAHFAVGGGLYLVLAERKGIREKSAAILDFTRSRARFFLLVTVVAWMVRKTLELHRDAD